MSSGAQSCALEPVFRKFLGAVGEVFAPEYAQFEHRFGGQFRAEVRMKVFPGRLCQNVGIAGLHEIIDCDSGWLHRTLWVNSVRGRLLSVSNTPAPPKSSHDDAKSEE